MGRHNFNVTTPLIIALFVVITLVASPSQIGGASNKTRAWTLVEIQEHNDKTLEQIESYVKTQKSLEEDARDSATDR